MADPVTQLPQVVPPAGGKPSPREAQEFQPLIRRLALDEVAWTAQVAPAGRLPFTDDCAACTVVMDSVFFTAEIRRVLRPDGVIIWATRLGAAAPFHLPVDVILQALGPGWTATAAQAGWGEWAVIRQSRLGHPSDSRARTTPQSPVSELHSPPSA